MLANDAHHAAEARFKQLIEEASLPLPDRVEYEPRAVIFCWEDTKTAVVVELDGSDPAP